MSAHVTPEKKKKMMLEDNVRTLILKMSVPTITAQLITTVYNLVDTFFVSTLGTNATAAVGVNSSLERTITLVGSLIGAGACSYIARLLGAKRDEEANRVMSTSFFSGFAIGLVILAAGVIWTEPLVNLLGATNDCRQYSMQYASYVLIAAPFMIGSYIMNMCLRSEGSATYAMVGIAFGGVLNCFLDPIFIYGMGLGVAGASMATAISKFISFCILLYPYLKKRTVVEITLKKIQFVVDDIKEVLAIGSTSFFRAAFSVLASILTNRIAGSFSTSALAALSVANRIMEFPFAIILGFGQGFQPVVGFNWGAKQKKRVKECFKFGSQFSIIGAIAIAMVLALIATPIVHVFNREADAEVLRLGVLCIRLQCATMVAHAWGSIINMFYCGVGKAKYALAMSTARQGYCFLPVLLIAPVVLGINGIVAAQALADLVSLLVAVPLGLKAMKVIEELEPAGN